MSVFSVVKRSVYFQVKLQHSAKRCHKAYY